MLLKYNNFQVAETGKRIKSLLADDVIPVVAQMADCLADWYKRAQTIYLKVRCIAILLHIVLQYFLLHRLKYWRKT